MNVITLIIGQHGGTATRAQILEVTTRASLRDALRAGEVTRHRRGVYGLALEDDLARVAGAGAVLSHRSAALHHDLPVLHAPETTEAIISRSRSIQVPDDLDLRFRALSGSDHDRIATSPMRTVVDCARDLPLPEALAVADSALRAGVITPEELTRASLPRTHRAAARRVLDLASARSANPFESGLRALALEATDHTWSPQLPVTLRDGTFLHADVGCAEVRVLLEADSHEFHKSRGDVMRDCHRYNEMIIAGWIVLRFAWEHVMFHPQWCREVIAWVVRQRQGVSRGSSRSA